jgi:hypothetical protein
VSATYWSHSDGFCYAESRAIFSKCSMKMLLMMGDRERSIAMPLSVGRTYCPPENVKIRKMAWLWEASLIILINCYPFREYMAENNRA